MDLPDARSTFSAGGKPYAFHDVRRVLGADAYARMPYVARVLAENLLRHVGRPGGTLQLVRALADPTVAADSIEMPLHVPRIVMPDSSGIPVLMDLAALRSAVARKGGDPARALTLTERLRAEKVVGAFIEFVGPSAARLTVPDRATLANMAP